MFFHRHRYHICRWLPLLLPTCKPRCSSPGLGWRPGPTPGAPLFSGGVRLETGVRGKNVKCRNEDGFSIPYQNNKTCSFAYFDKELTTVFIPAFCISFRGRLSAHGCNSTTGRPHQHDICRSVTSRNCEGRTSMINAAPLSFTNMIEPY